jgi:hypothetical protein
VPEPGSPFQGRQYRRSFWDDLGKVFTYPLTGQGIAAIVIGGVFFGIAQLIAKFSCAGWLVSIVATAYLLTYEFRIINSVAQGEEEPPGWPDPQGVFETLFLVFCTYAVCFGPAVLCFIMAFVAALQIGPLAIVFIPAGIVFLLVGSFYFPMAYMMTVLFTSPAAALNVPFGFRAIAKIFPEYIVVVIISSFFLALPYGIAQLFSLAGIFGISAAIIASLMSIFVTTVVGLYLRLANGYMLGRLYYTCERRLDWFPGTEERTGPIQQIYGGGSPAPGPGDRPTPERRPPPRVTPQAPEAMAGGQPLPDLPSRRKAPDFGTAKWAADEDPFQKPVESKARDKAKQEDDWGELFDSAKRKALTEKKPAPPEPSEPAAPAPQPQDDGLRSRSADFYGSGSSGTLSPTMTRHQGRPPTGKYPVQGGQGPEQPPQPGPEPQAPSPFAPKPAADDHAGPVRFSPEVKDLIGRGAYAEARRIVEQKRDSARNRGDLAEMSFYRKQLDIIETMEKI